MGPYYLLFLLIASITLIVWLTAFKKLNAFFALLIAAVAVGLFSGLTLEKIPVILKSGFGHTMEKIGLLIILGTALGVILEKTGATTSMATFILKQVREQNAPAAISITGFIVGLPLFCDSGFIILNGLNHSLVGRTHFRMPVMATCLATSLYAVHCLVPPHPGITAAVGTVGADIGWVMLGGILLAIPATFVGYRYCVWKGNDMEHSQDVQAVETRNEVSLPPAMISFLPVLLPIFLIALKSVLSLLIDEAPSRTFHFELISFFGEPVVALGVALVVSLILFRKQIRSGSGHWLAEGVEKAGMILAIIAAGGMFGEMLQSTGIGKNLGDLLGKFSLGIFFPFLIALILKTAQGSTTVAIITAASLVNPVLPQLGLDGRFEQIFTILSMGAGSMIVSHANDAYFWVISRFSNLDPGITLRVYSVATILMGIAVQVMLWAIFVLFV